MTSFLRRFAGKIVTFRRGEASTALLMFAYSFLAMTAYNILKPVTRSQFINKLGADNLPYVQLAAGLVIGLLMQLYSWGVVKLPRRWVIPVTVAGEAALLLVFWGLFRTGATWVSVAFYVLGNILGVLLISQFWTLANDVYDPRQAKRLFGFIGGGASLGGVMGNALTAYAVEEIGTNNLLLVSGGILMICVGVVTLIVRHRDIKSDVVADERGVGGAEAIRLLSRSRHLQIIALVIAFAAIGAGIIEQQVNMATASAKGVDADAITRFLALVGIYVSTIGLVVQVGLTSRIHRSLGLAFALLVLPMSLGTTAIVILLNGALWAPAAARVLDSSLRYSIDKTTREVLFLPLPIDVKYRAKAFIDVTMDRFAKAVGALLCLVLIKPWGLHFTWQQLSYASLAVTATWIFVAMLARREYLKAFRHSIGERVISPAAVRFGVADAATIETLVEELSNPDEAAVLYAIDMLETFEKRSLITPLLLHHDSPKVRARALVALESARPAVATYWLPAVERMLRDEDADVRAGAMRALAGLRKEDTPGLVRQFLDDPKPRVVVTAAVVLAGSSRQDDIDTAYAALTRLIAGVWTAEAAARQEVAAALGRITHARFRMLLVPLLHDRDTDVVREAIKSVRAVGAHDPLFVPALISLLGNRMVKREAREVLVGYGDAATDTLAYVLLDRDEEAWVRRHIPSTLALRPCQKSMDALFSALDDPDGFLRYKVVEAIETLRRDHPALVFAKASIEARVIQETARYYAGLTLRCNVVSHDKQGKQSLLVRALEDKLERILDRIYRLLSLVYPWKDITDARFSIEQGDVRRRAAAIEYLDTLLHGTIRTRVMPILDAVPMAEKVQHANAVLKTRPRDLEDTLAQLVHDDDPVVCAAAIHFIETRQVWSLAGDLEFVLEHRPASDWWVFEAASWTLAARRVGERRKDLWLEPLPTVELVDRLRGIPLFQFVSIDELFRIASLGRQLRHENGRRLYQEGDAADDVQLLLDGTVAVSHGGSATGAISAPAALGFEDVLEGRPIRRTIHTSDRAVCLVLGREEFLTLLSDNIVVAKGLFRMLLCAARDRDAPAAAVVVPERQSAARRRLPLEPIDKVQLLREHPLLGRATVDQLLDLVAITREVTLTKGSVLFTANDRPAMYHVVNGEVLLEGDAVAPIIARSGETIGVAETLTGLPIGRKATVTRDGQALCLGHDELFDVLADHIDLLQGLFSGVLGASDDDVPLMPGSPVLQAVDPEVVEVS